MTTPTTSAALTKAAAFRFSPRSLWGQVRSGWDNMTTGRRDLRDLRRNPRADGDTYAQMDAARKQRSAGRREVAKGTAGLAGEAALAGGAGYGGYRALRGSSDAAPQEPAAGTKSPEGAGTESPEGGSSTGILGTVGRVVKHPAFLIGAPSAALLAYMLHRRRRRDD